MKKKYPTVYLLMQITDKGFVGTVLGVYATQEAAEKDSPNWSAKYYIISEYVRGSRLSY